MLRPFHGRDKVSTDGHVGFRFRLAGGGSYTAVRLLPLLWNRFDGGAGKVDWDAIGFIDGFGGDTRGSVENRLVNNLLYVMS